MPVARDNTHGQVELTAAIIKKVYKSWRFSASKITVADATALALFDSGLLTSVKVEVDLDKITVDRLVKKYRPRDYRINDDD